MARILIVNDEADLAEVCRFALQWRGYDVHTRLGADGLREAVSELSPDVLVLDWIVGDTTADRLLPELRDVTDGTGILVISASPNLESTARSLGATSFLGKPFDVSRFIAEVKRLVDGRRRLDGHKSIEAE